MKQSMLILSYAVGFIINFPFYTIEQFYEIAVEPVDGEYGLAVRGNFTLVFSMNGEMLTIGDIFVRLCAKNCGEIQVKVACMFILKNGVTFHRYYLFSLLFLFIVLILCSCSFKMYGKLEFAIPIPIDKLTGLPIDGELGIVPALSVTIHLIAAYAFYKNRCFYLILTLLFSEYDTNGDGYYVGNGLNFWAEGDFDIELSISVGIGSSYPLFIILFIIRLFDFLKVVLDWNSPYLFHLVFLFVLLVLVDLFKAFVWYVFYPSPSSPSSSLPLTLTNTFIGWWI